MTTAGPNAAGTGTDDNAVGTLSITNVGNITGAVDSVEATAVNNSGTAQTHYFKGTNYGFSIPSATIDGIELQITRYANTPSGGNTKDSIVKLVKGGSVVGSNYADTVTAWHNGFKSGTANAAVTTTNTTLTDTRLALEPNAAIGDVISCNGKTMTVTSNTATTFTGASWSGGGNPGNGKTWANTGGSIGDTIVYGGPTDLWGTTWTDSDVNASDFGAVLSASITKSGKNPQYANVDAMRITIYYTAGGGGGGQPTSKRFGGVPFMGAHGSGLQAPVRQWIRRASGLLTPQFATTQIWRPAHGID